MTGNPKSEDRNPKADSTGAFLTRRGLAVVLQVSVCTVDRMVANGELPCVRLGRRVRFYLPDVVEALRNGNRKFGRKATQPVGLGNPKAETRAPKEAA
jgi:excisionase family DNA binding protein